MDNLTRLYRGKHLARRCVTLNWGQEPFLGNIFKWNKTCLHLTRGKLEKTRIVSLMYVISRKSTHISNEFSHRRCTLRHLIVLQSRIIEFAMVEWLRLCAFAMLDVCVCVCMCMCVCVCVHACTCVPFTKSESVYMLSSSIRQCHIFILWSLLFTGQCIYDVSVKLGFWYSFANVFFLFFFFFFFFFSLSLSLSLSPSACSAWLASLGLIICIQIN